MYVPVFLLIKNGSKSTHRGAQKRLAAVLDKNNVIKTSIARLALALRNLVRILLVYTL